jgi:flagellin
VAQGSLLGANARVELAFERTQSQLSTDVRRLSSGLRVQTAADDPSGLAIGTKLQVKAAGLDAGASSITTANNALTVADGALATVGAILTRIRTLFVQASDDFKSHSDLEDIDAEIQALKAEINRIASNTTFNGINLLDGSLDTSAPRPASVVQVTPPQDPRVPNTRPDLASGSPYVYDIAPGYPGYGPPADAYVQFGVASFDAATNTYGYRQLAYSTDPTFGPNQDEVYTFGAGGGGIGLIFPDPSPDNRGEVQFQANTVTAADVGVADAFEVTAARAGGNGKAASVAVGDVEGDTVAISVPGCSTTALDIASVTVLPGALTNFTATTDDYSNIYIVYDGQYRVDQAIAQLSNARAILGAQIVSLGESVNNSNVASVQLTASASAILDTDIGQSTTDFTRAQILTSAATAVLSRNDSLAYDVLALFR